MSKTFYQQAEDLKKEAIEVILSKCKSMKSGRKVFRNLKDIGYCMDDGGYSCEQLGCVTKEREVYFVEEGAEFSSNYDFEDDPNNIVVGSYGLDSLTYQGLFDIADAIDRKGAFASRFEEIEVLAKQAISSLRSEINIEPTLVNLDLDSNWYSTNAVIVADNYFIDEDGATFKYEDVDGYGTHFCTDELILLADAVNNAK